MLQGAFPLLKVVLKRLGIRTARFKGRMEECGLVLRLCRFRDLPAVHSLCDPEIFLTASDAHVRAFGSLASLWSWIHKTFQVFYLIELEEKIAHRIIGFVGIYKTELGESLWVSLVLFDVKDRRRGYGQYALELLLTSLQEDRIVQRVYAEALACNTGSLRLLEKLGFNVFAQEHGRLFLQKQLGCAMETGPP